MKTNLLGEAIATLRKENDLSQEDLARELDIESKWIKYVELGIVDIPDKAISIIKAKYPEYVTKILQAHLKDTENRLGMRGENLEM